MTCPGCSFENRPTAKFCENCGQPLAAARPAAESERKLVTVLFTDIVGSTALAEGLDPEEWGEIVAGAHKRISDAVYRRDGTIAQLLGDGVLAFFGAPVTHEDDPIRAVTAASDILAAIRDYARDLTRLRRIERFQMRVGLNTGLVVAGSVGSDRHTEYLAVGDTVNLGARLQSVAEPDSILVSASTARLVKHAFVLEPRGPFELKGKAELVPAFCVSGRKAIPEPARGIEGLRSPIVGRDGELRQLADRLDELRAGRGGVISLVGEAGLGKSRLLAEVRQQAVPGDTGGLAGSTSAASPGSVRWLEGRALSYEATTAYAPFAFLLRGLFEIEPDAEQPNSDAYANLKAGVAGAVGERAGDVAPFLASVLGIRPEGDDVERIKYLEPPALRARVFQAMGELVDGLARQAPLVLAFEDLHWADSTSLDLLAYLLPLTEQVPLAVIALFRPQRQEPSWQIHEVALRDYPDRYLALLLEPLDPTSSRQLVANLLHVEDLPEKVRQLILTKAEGNPFFVEEMIRSLLDAKLVVRENAHWRATREIADIAVPDTLAGVIGARLDRLPAESRRVAQTASVIGREFPFDLLARVSERGAPLEEPLVDLQRRELIRESARVPDLVYLFKHALTQDAAYSSLLLSRRRTLHRSVAESLERSQPERAADIARHYLEAREEALALPHLVAAGERSAAAYATTVAIEQYRRAIGILQTVHEVALARRAYEGLGSALTLANDLPGSVDAYHQMLHYGEAQGDVPMRVSALNKLSMSQLFLGRFPEVEHHLTDAESLARDNSDLSGLAEMFWVRCAACSMIADFSNAIKHLNETVQIGRAMNVVEHVAFGLTHTANTLGWMTRFDEMWTAAQEGLEIARSAGNLRFVAEILAFPVPLHYLVEGDLDAAADTADEAVKIALRIGSAFAESLGTMILGSIALARGEYQSAVTLFLQSSEAGARSSYPFMVILGTAALAHAYAELGPTYHQQIGEFHERALKMLEHPTGVTAAGFAWVDLGFCLLQNGRADAAAELFQKGLTVPTTHGILNRPLFLLGAALAALARGELDPAAGYARQARALVDEIGMAHVSPGVSLAEGLIESARGDGAAAIRHLTTAEERALSLGLRPVAWQARAEAARVLDRMGSAGEAADKRAAARAMVREIGGRFTDDALRSAYLTTALARIGEAHISEHER